MDELNLKDLSVDEYKTHREYPSEAREIQADPCPKQGQSLPLFSLASAIKAHKRAKMDIHISCQLAFKSLEQRLEEQTTLREKCQARLNFQAKKSANLKKLLGVNFKEISRLGLGLTLAKTELQSSLIRQQQLEQQIQVLRKKILETDKWTKQLLSQLNLSKELHQLALSQRDELKTQLDDLAVSQASRLQAERQQHRAELERERNGMLHKYSLLQHRMAEIVRSKDHSLSQSYQEIKGLLSQIDQLHQALRKGDFQKAKINKESQNKLSEEKRLKGELVSSLQAKLKDLQYRNQLGLHKLAEKEAENTFLRTQLQSTRDELEKELQVQLRAAKSGLAQIQKLQFREEQLQGQNQRLLNLAERLRTDLESSNGKVAQYKHYEEAVERAAEQEQLLQRIRRELATAKSRLDQQDQYLADYQRLKGGQQTQLSDALASIKRLQAQVGTLRGRVREEQEQCLQLRLLLNNAQVKNQLYENQTSIGRQQVQSLQNQLKSAKLELQKVQKEKEQATLELEAERLVPRGNMLKQEALSKDCQFYIGRIYFLEHQARLQRQLLTHLSSELDSARAEGSDKYGLQVLGIQQRFEAEESRRERLLSEKETSLRLEQVWGYFARRQMAKHYQLHQLKAKSYIEEYSAGRVPEQARTELVRLREECVRRQVGQLEQELQIQRLQQVRNPELQEVDALLFGLVNK